MDVGKSQSRFPRPLQWRPGATLLRKTFAHWREHGVSDTIRRAAAWCTAGSEDFVITRATLNGPPVADRVGDVVFRLATAADLPLFHGHERFGSRLEMLGAHIRGGDWLFIATLGGRFVAARLITRTVPGRDVASRVLKLMPHQVWDDDMYCASDYRGQGIARQLSLFSARYMASLGYTEAFARIATSNVPSLRMQRHKGSTFAWHVSSRRLLFFRRVRASRRVPPGRAGSEVIATLPRTEAGGQRRG